jgi:hypothetical protein
MVRGEPFVCAFTCAPFMAAVNPRTMHLTLEELESGLETIRQSPKNAGVLELIVRRPRKDEREEVERGTSSRARGSKAMFGGSSESRAFAKMRSR